jgi:succinate dehydrogenase / fumarate reductase, membrane anchor subunit
MSNLRHPIAKARGLGSAKAGLHHWWVQRTTAVALALLTPWFIYLMVSTIGLDAQTVRAALSSPLNSILLVVFSISLFWHAALGLQVVVEDYIHLRWQELFLQVLIKFIYTLATVISLYAIGRMAFTA